MSDWTPVPEKQSDITPEEVENGPYPEPDMSVLVTAWDTIEEERLVLMSSLLPQVWNDKYKWLQSDGPAVVIAWKEMPNEYEGERYD